MQNYIQRGQLQVATQLDAFIESEALPGSGITSSTFWANFSDIVAQLTPINDTLLVKRDTLQQTIDQYAARTKGYNPKRGQHVIEYARKWLDVIAPLAKGSHQGSRGYDITSGQLVITLHDRSTTTLTQSARFLGFSGDIAKPNAILIQHNGLHVELQFDRTHQVGKDDPAGMKDILVESALTTIMDCEDSVAAVDGEDKTLVYQNWLGLIKGTLEVTLGKPDSASIRRLNPDRTYTSTDGNTISLSGRSMMFIRQT